SCLLMPRYSQYSDSDEGCMWNGTKCSWSSALQLGPRKHLSVQDPLVHHGRHFGCVIHAFCNVQTLLTNGITLMVEVEERGPETLTQEERKEYSAFQELLKIVLNLEDRIMSSSKQDVIAVAELIHKGISRARSDDTKSMKAAIIDWITPKGQALIPHIPRNVKMG
ncbi:hypothetical protein PISMIDRAFT_102207, partial [Pisolithus microcarpus 441]